MVLLTEVIGCLLQQFNIVAFRAEREHGTSYEVEKVQSAESKNFGGLATISKGQHQYNIGAAIQRHMRSNVFIIKGRGAALNKIAAEHTNNHIGAGDFCFVQYDSGGRCERGHILQQYPRLS